MAAAGETDQDQEPEYGGLAKVKRELVFDAPLSKLVAVFQQHRDELMESPNNKIINRDGDRVTMRISLLGGTVTDIILEQQQGSDEATGEAFFRSKVVETDGFITRQDVLIRIKSRGNQTVVVVEITVVIPEVRTSVVRTGIALTITKMDKKLRQYLKD